MPTSYTKKFSFPQAIQNQNYSNCTNISCIHLLGRKLFHLLNRSKPEISNPIIFKILQEISLAFETFAPYTFPLLRFRTTILPDENFFHRELVIDLMYIKRGLLVVDTATNFQNAIFIKSKSTDDLWQDFTTCWVAVYTSFPQNIRLDPKYSLLPPVFDKIPKTSLLTFNLVILNHTTPLYKANDIIIHCAVFLISPLKSNSDFLTHKSYGLPLKPSTTPRYPMS